MKNTHDLAEFYEKESPIPFYAMLCFFVITNMLLVINYVTPVAIKILTLRKVINAILLITCVMYIAFNLLIWKMSVPTAAAAAGLIVLTGLSWNTLGHTYEFFCTAVAALLALISWKRDYRMILKIILTCHIMTMVIAAAGLVIGYTQPAYKLDSTDFGVSLGLIYPNHVGRMLLIILLIAWYLWGQEKRILTALVMWAVAAVLWHIVKCTTVALMFILFPILWWGVALLLRISERRAVEKSQGKAVDRKKTCMIIMNILLAPMPFYALAGTYILGLFRNFFLIHWHYGQKLYALWMRFISAGILFRSYGFPLFGRPMEERNVILEVTNEQGYVAAIVDNAYVFYLLAIGGIALIACLLWLSYGNYKMLKEKDYALLLISFFLCGYGLIETAYFQFEHNFLWFYPLALSGLVTTEPAHATEQATEQQTEQQTEQES